MKKLIIILVTLIAFSGCKDPYETGHFPDDVTNFIDVNSEYDDYNSDLKAIRNRYMLRFSTNRNSNGNDFDIIAKEINIWWDQETGFFEIYANNLDTYYAKEEEILDVINTSDNELGPYSVEELLLYANDSNGNYDIKFIDNLSNSPLDIDFLKSEANELYPSFYGKDFYFHNKYPNIKKIEKLIYCSDKEGDFNIYEVSIPNNSNIVDVLRSSETYESAKLNINSSFDEKCPFVNGNLLVFASNREGGYGGFDLYYSINQNGKWSEPVNFGEKINSQYDEYRPVTLYVDGFDNNMLLFSSNRPSGLGGFDLYYVGIKQMIK